ncbi:hypothetical protein KM043_011556 [Ampulex compressa]|nr:hypothetical protein KM043_011556 [Ampulex compressa]
MTEEITSKNIVGKSTPKDSKKVEDKNDTSAAMAVSKTRKKVTSTLKTTDKKGSSSKPRCISNPLNNLVIACTENVEELQISDKKRKRVRKKQYKIENTSTKEQLNKCTDSIQCNADTLFKGSKADRIFIEPEVEPRKKQKKTKKLNDKKNDTRNTKGEDQRDARVNINSKSVKNHFSNYMDKAEIEKILNNQCSDNKQYVHGYLRINLKFHEHAYVTLPDEESDLLIVGSHDRNRAFDGDLVVASVYEEEKWLSLAEGKKQKTGAIVYILDKIHPRIAIGCIKKAKRSVIFYARDPRIPLIKLHEDSIPHGFEQQPELYKHVLFLVKIITWNKPQWAIGTIEEEIGPEGDLLAESNAILLEHDLDVTPYSDELLKGLPSADYIPTNTDIKGREDWRKKCIFTIDPATAVDLDDAVSCEVLDNGNYEIGVHIADVTHYLTFLSPLDVNVAKRATTVYMTEKVYHMLPKQLCQTCSLLPVHLQNERCAGGALNIDLPKIHITLDSVTGIPISCDVQKEEDSNRLIKEFMLLANMTVATHLYNEIPETALLREHKKPVMRVILRIKEMLQKFGIHLDIDSAERLQASITRYASEVTTDSVSTNIVVKYRMMVLNNLCATAMTRALYKCASSVRSKDDLKHYALNVPLYTHFTSPIRRYSDCVVHRLLYSTIEHKKLPQGWTKKLCAQIAENCNIKKYSAAMAQEKSSVLYFTYLVHLIGPLNTIAIVLYVKERSIEVILCHIGIKLKISFADTQDLFSVQYSLKSTVPTIFITWKESGITQVITTFSLLQVRVQKDLNRFRLNGVLLPPLE